MENLKYENYAEPIWSKQPLNWKLWSIPIIIFLFTHILAAVVNLLSSSYTEQNLTLIEFLSITTRFIVVNFLIIFIITYLMKSFTNILKNDLERKNKCLIGRIRKFLREKSIFDFILISSLFVNGFAIFFGTIYDSLVIYNLVVIAKYSLIYSSAYLVLICLRKILYPSYDLVVDFIEKEKELEESVKKYLTDEKLTEEEKEDILLNEIDSLRNFLIDLDIFFGSRTGVPLGNIEEISSHMILDLIEQKEGATLSFLDYIIDIKQAIVDNSVSDIIKILNEIGRGIANKSDEYRIIFKLTEYKEEKKKDRFFLGIIISIIVALLVVFFTPLIEYLGQFLIDLFGV